jgi:hypothetical protein
MTLPTIQPMTQHTSITPDARNRIVVVGLPTNRPMQSEAVKLASAKQDAMTLAGMAEHSFAQDRPQSFVKAFYFVARWCKELCTTVEHLWKKSEPRSPQ